MNKVTISEPDVKTTNTAEQSHTKRKFKVEGFVV
jgi:hypothetical protein